MRIVHVAAEFAPLAKAGGLGEVLVGLTREQIQMGHEVTTLLPAYPWIHDTKDFPVHLLSLPGYFNREKIYGYPDDIARFTHFSKKAIEYIRSLKKPIDILHLHDWHTALCALLAKDLPVKAIVLSIHNVEYQGRCAAHDLPGINTTTFQDDVYPNTVNLLKAGIVHSDAVIPVSESYAKEILTPKFGFGLEKTLQTHKHKITGIVNGIDQVLWNPTQDSFLKMQLSVESIENAKKANKETFPVEKGKIPWVGAITRIVPQKGPELIEEALRTTLELGGAFCLLGASPMPALQKHFDQLKEKYKNNPRVFLCYEYNEEIAHRLYAALDLLIVPSHTEPCGLTQLIAMRYGTVPLVRATGGLKDTVFDCEDTEVTAMKRNGFVFQEPTRNALNGALKRAFTLFNKDPASFSSLIRRGMQSDFSWKKPAKEYDKVYLKAMK